MVRHKQHECQVYQPCSIEDKSTLHTQRVYWPLTKPAKYPSSSKYLLQWLTESPEATMGEQIRVRILAVRVRSPA